MIQGCSKGFTILFHSKAPSKFPDCSPAAQFYNQEWEKTKRLQCFSVSPTTFEREIREKTKSSADAGLTLGCSLQVGKEGVSLALEQLLGLHAGAGTLTFQGEPTLEADQFCVAHLKALTFKLNVVVWPWTVCIRLEC